MLHCEETVWVQMDERSYPLARWSSRPIPAEKCLLPPRLLPILRSAPCHHHPELLAEYELITRSTTEALCNIHLDYNSWSQTKLPARYGGLELSTAADLALPAFQSSRARVSAWLTTSSVSQRTNKRTTMRFGLGWTKIKVSYFQGLVRTGKAQGFNTCAHCQV